MDMHIVLGACRRDMEVFSYRETYLLGGRACAGTYTILGLVTVACAVLLRNGLCENAEAANATPIGDGANSAGPKLPMSRLPIRAVNDDLIGSHNAFIV